MNVAEGSASSTIVGARALAIFLISLLPLAVSPVIPMIDFYNHVARYFVLTHIQDSAALQDNYAVAWKLLPNLGLDVLALPAFRLLPPLAAAKAIIILIFAVQFGGVLALNRALNGRMSIAAALLAGILLYSYIFIWGFANFLLANGLSFWCLALWLKLRERNLWLAAMACSGFAVLIFLCHGFAFALYGIMLALLEFGRWRLSQRRRIADLTKSALAVGVQAVVPAILFLATPTAHAGPSADDIVSGHRAPELLINRVAEIAAYQASAIVRVANSPWLALDVASFVVVAGLCIWGVRRGVIRISPTAFPALAVIGLLCVVTPPSLFGVGKISDRVPLVGAMLLAASLGIGRRGAAKGLSGPVVGLALLLLARIAANIIAFAPYRDDFRDFVAVMEKVPSNAIVGAASPPEGRERNTLTRRCEMYGPLVVPLFGHPAPLFANPTQQPLALKGPLADLTGRSKQASDSHDDPLAAKQSSFRYYIACGYPDARIAGFRTLAQKGRFLLLEKP